MCVCVQYSLNGRVDLLHLQQPVRTVVDGLRDELHQFVERSQQTRACSEKTLWLSGLKGDQLNNFAISACTSFEVG